MVFCRDKKAAIDKFNRAGVPQAMMPAITHDAAQFTNFVAKNTMPKPPAQKEQNQVAQPMPSANRKDYKNNAER